MKERPAICMQGLLPLITFVALIAFGFFVLRGFTPLFPFLVLAAFLILKGLFIVGPNEARVLIFFGKYIGTVRQNFVEMSKIAATQLNLVFAGGPVEAEELYAPAELITRESLGVTCP